jgi:hypothetical protein
MCVPASKLPERARGAIASFSASLTSPSVRAPR